MAVVRIKVTLSTMSAQHRSSEMANLHPINQMLEGSILFSIKYIVVK